MVWRPAVRRWAACPLALAAVCVACTAAPSPPARASRPQLSGELLSVTGTQSSTSLVRFRLPDGSTETFASPIDPEALNRSAVAGASSSGGSLFVTVVRHAAQVYRLAAGGSDPSLLGPSLEVRLDEPMLSVGERAVVVADCATVRILALPDPRRWVRVGRGCWGAVSPDGRSVAVAPDGRRISEVSPTGDARGALLLDVRDLAPALGLGSEVPRLVGTPAWGPAGLAFLVRAGDQLGVFVRDPEGGIAEVLQEPYLNPHRVPRVAWSPDGEVLAIADDVGPSGAVLRAFDPSSGELRAVSLAPVGFSGIAWAPDGESIALLTGAEQLVVVRLDGTWLLRRATDWETLLGWSRRG